MIKHDFNMIYSQIDKFLPHTSNDMKVLEISQLL